MTIQTRSLEEGVRAGDHVSTAVVEAVAEATGDDPAALPPLYERADPDALESLFAPTSVGMPRAGKIEFSYCGYTVTVACDDDGTRITLDGRAE